MWGERERDDSDKTHHYQRPDAVVEEYDRGSHEHGEADEFVQLSMSKGAKVSSPWALRRVRTTALSPATRVGAVANATNYPLSEGKGTTRKLTIVELLSRKRVVNHGICGK